MNISILRIFQFTLSIFLCMMKNYKWKLHYTNFIRNVPVQPKPAGKLLKILHGKKTTAISAFKQKLSFASTSQMHWFQFTRNFFCAWSRTELNKFHLKISSPAKTWWEITEKDYMAKRHWRSLHLTMSYLLPHLPQQIGLLLLKQGSRSARLSPQSMTFHECMCSSMLVVTLWQ